jgi:hypothetical protein
MLTLQFQELEFWLADSFTLDGSTPDIQGFSGTGQDALLTFLRQQQGGLSNQ